MAKTKKIEIDLNEWAIPSELAKEFDVSYQVVNNWKLRGKLETWKIKELGITLVRFKPKTKKK